MKKNISFLMVLSFGFLMAKAQSFERTIFRTNLDFNHYSIEKTSTGEYVLAGTLFNSGASNNDIHVLKLDPMGNMVWERKIDLTDDDRALDVAVDASDNIVIVGYSKQLTPAGMQPFPYMAKFNPGGALMGNLYFDGVGQGAATNVIYSQTTNAYIVGGFSSGNFSNPLNNNVAFVGEIPLNLIGPANWMRTFEGDGQRHSSINDIVEIPGVGYFVTGSVDFFAGNYRQTVLAHFMNFAGAATFDLSFNSSNAAHVGVSAVYYSNDNRLYVMSNNTIVHSAQITVISNVTGVPFIGPSYYLELDPTYGSRNAAGFQLLPSVSNPNNLVAAGYFKHYGVGGNSANTWLAEFNKTTGANVTTMVHNVPSNNFSMHGGGLLSTFTGQQPYIFNQEIVTRRGDNNGYVFVGPITMGTNFGISVVSTTSNSAGISCLDPYNWSNISIGSSAMNATPGTISELTDGGVVIPTGVGSSILPQCTVFFRLKPDEKENVEDENEDQMTISPNPFNDQLKVQLKGELKNEKITIIDSQGKVVYRNDNVNGTNPTLLIDLGDLAAGIYLLRKENGAGDTEFSKLIKR